MKSFFIIFLLVTNALANDYNFTESRYSYAFDRSAVLKGVIAFKVNALHIKYENDNREIFYDDSSLVIKENGNTLEFDEIELQRISVFFEILQLIYTNADLDDRFEIQRIEDKVILTPNDDLVNYIEKISLIKIDKKLKEVKLFLINQDTITISIEDEIR